MTSLTRRYAELDKTFQEENMKLTDKYKEITELFKDLQHKYKHFEEADCECRPASMLSCR